VRLSKAFPSGTLMDHLLVRLLETTRRSFSSPAASFVIHSAPAVTISTTFSSCAIRTRRVESPFRPTLVPLP
jgi:hypothetical protein